MTPILLLTAACSGSDGDPTGDGVQETVGNISITTHFTPDPPIAGENTLHIHVEDLDGNPLTGAAVSVDPQMPMMGHGSNVDAVVTEDGNGDYTAAPVAFTMIGEWEVTVDVAAGDASGELVLKVTIE